MSISDICRYRSIGETDIRNMEHLNHNKFIIQLRTIYVYSSPLGQWQYVVSKQITTYKLIWFVIMISIKFLKITLYIGQIGRLTAYQH